MAFPKRLLIEGEQLVLDLRPHWIALVMPVLGVIAILVIQFFLYQLNDSWFDDSNAVNVVIGVLAVVAILAFPVRRFISWFTSIFAVTSDRVIHREGFIAKRSMEIPLEAINDVRFEQGVIDRIVGAGTLLISSASETGTNSFKDIRHPEDVQKTIYHQGELNKKRMYHGEAAAAPPPPTPAGAPSTTAELERLAKLRADGVLTEEEFQVQKTKILGS
jgi:uncharacterized membrane protein YdbT with pleckstrin-like domain